MAAIEQIMAAKRLEMFTVGGIAETVLAADVMAWNALENVLGGDPVGAWALKGMSHTYVQLQPDENGAPRSGVEFKAEFYRNPNHEE